MSFKVLANEEIIKNGYKVIAKGELIGEPARLINRGCEVQPFVVAIFYDESSQNWGSGHYFNNESEAWAYIRKREAIDALKLLDNAILAMNPENEEFMDEIWRTFTNKFGL